MNLSCGYGTGAPVAGASTGGQLTNDTTYYLVCNIIGAALFYLSENVAQPELERRSWTRPLEMPRSHFHSNRNAITHIFFRAAVWDATDILRADELKIGTAWSDVVPSAGPAIPAVGVSTSPSSYIPVTAQTVTAGNSITVYAVALDGSGNYVANTPATWSPINVTAGIAGSDIVPANGGRSAVFTGHLVGSANLRATPPTGATNYNDSGLITVAGCAGVTGAGGNAGGRRRHGGAGAKRRARRRHPHGLRHQPGPVLETFSETSPRRGPCRIRPAAWWMATCRRPAAPVPPSPAISPGRPTFAPPRGCWRRWIPV